KLRDSFKIHPVNSADQSRRQKEYGCDGKSFDDLILLVTDEIERCALEISHLRNQVRLILSERVDIAVQRFEIRSRAIIEPGGCVLTEKRQKPVDTEETFAKLSKQRRVPPKLLNRRLEIEARPLLTLRRRLPIK